MTTTHYEDKIASLRAIFGAQHVEIAPNGISVDHKFYPVVDGVIILLDPSQYTPHVRAALALAGASSPRGDDAEDIQFTFGEEWKTYAEVLPEHADEFAHYFDVVDLGRLKNARVCDLGCGIGRWSVFLQERCKELVLVDFSDAIFVARKNVTSPHALFFMADARALPFRDGFCDMVFSLGVLHHLPVPCLSEVRRIGRYAPAVLVYLYYALDNRPFYFRWLLALVTVLRAVLCRIRAEWFRRTVSFLGAVLVYKPMVLLGAALRPLGLASGVPLYAFYRDKGLRRIEQDVYDRFFTRIEQRVSRKEIAQLSDTYSKVTVSENHPYWHFLCEQ